MAPIVPPLAQSESKARFFTRLGLDPSNPMHKRVYGLMKLEAAEGRRRLMESQTSSTAQIHEAAWQREVLRIFDDARPETKAVYQFGHDTADGEATDNWIIRWLLWHVFRYRDYRNKNRPPGPNPPPPPSSSSSDDDQPPPPPSTQTDPGGGSGEGGAGAGSSNQADQAGKLSPNAYWDPIREQWQS